MQHESLSPPPTSPAPDTRQGNGQRWPPRKMTGFLRARLKGELVGTSRRNDEQLAAALLKLLTPGRRGAMVSATFGTFRASRPARNPRSA